MSATNLLDPHNDQRAGTSMALGDGATVFAGRRPLSTDPITVPTLVVVVDTEEEFDHSAPFDYNAMTTNILLQRLAQPVMERYDIVPTYVIDYPVAVSLEAREVLLPLLQSGRCDIGAHLHPWVNPPQEGPVDERHSYPGNLSPALEREKLERLTDAITRNFDKRPVIYKAGRYGVGPATAAILRDLGYRIDVSVVPYTDFSGRFGPNFAGFADTPFAIGDDLIGLPLSVGFAGALAAAGPRWFPRLNGRLGQKARLPAFAARLGLLERLRLSPEGHSLSDMQRQTRAAIRRGKKLFMLTYHSSSLLPGATPYVRSPEDRQRFIRAIDGYVSFFTREIGGRPDTVANVAARLTA